jgi:uncharacterized membrane protein YecN with MAPEG domain
MLSLLLILQSETVWIWLAAAAFFAGGIVNATGVSKIRDSFADLGFPAWWCWITGALELATALLLLFHASRAYGVALGACIMIAALAAILRQKAYGHLPAPLLFLFLLVSAGISHHA